MTEQTQSVEAKAVKVEPKVVDAKSVLLDSVTREKARDDVDLELVAVLESTILRVDASDDAWEQAVSGIKNLASSRAASRMEAR